MSINSIHPFPARMAPEVALRALETVPPGGLVVDPMCGSGVVVRAAAERSFRAVGIDTDPLAVLMTRVWTTRVDLSALLARAERVARQAQRIPDASVILPWIDGDEETVRFIEYWFAPRQRTDLRRLAAMLADGHGPLNDALKVAFSRLIITKSRGASLARDTSHSRPHRVAAANDFDVFLEFPRAVRMVAERLQPDRIQTQPVVTPGDARAVTAVRSGSAAAVVTSPPYLNAIDYMRGHRLSLVWLGYTMADLRAVRARNIGAEVAPLSKLTLASVDDVRSRMPETKALQSRLQRMIARYAMDMGTLLREIARMLMRGGKAVLVVGNSTLRGIFVSNSAIVAHEASRVGLQLQREEERVLPANLRYLPAPRASGTGGLDKRMRTEVVMTFSRT